VWRAFAQRHAKRGLLARASCEPRACGDCGGLWRGSLCVGCARGGSAKNRVNKNLRWFRARPESGHRRRTPQAKRGRLDTHAPSALARVTLHHAPTRSTFRRTHAPSALARVTARHPRLRKSNPRWRGSHCISRQHDPRIRAHTHSIRAGAGHCASLTQLTPHSPNSPNSHHTHPTHPTHPTHTTLTPTLKPTNSLRRQ